MSEKPQRSVYSKLVSTVDEQGLFSQGGAALSWLVLQYHSPVGLQCTTFGSPAKLSLFLIFLLLPRPLHSDCSRINEVILDILGLRVDIILAGGMTVLHFIMFKTISIRNFTNFKKNL